MGLWERLGLDRLTPLRDVQYDGGEPTADELVLETRVRVTFFFANYLIAACGLMAIVLFLQGGAARWPVLITGLAGLLLQYGAAVHCGKLDHKTYPHVVGNAAAAVWFFLGVFMGLQNGAFGYDAQALLLTAPIIAAMTSGPRACVAFIFLSLFQIWGFYALHKSGHVFPSRNTHRPSFEAYAFANTLIALGVFAVYFPIARAAFRKHRPNPSTSEYSNHAPVVSSTVSAMVALVKDSSASEGDKDQLLAMLQTLRQPADASDACQEGPAEHLQVQLPGSADNEAGEDAPLAPPLIVPAGVTMENETSTSVFFMLHPHSPFRLVYDKIYACALLFTVIEVPTRLCFEYDVGRSILFLIMVLSNIFFIADVFFHFRFAYFDAENKLVDSPRAVALRYLKGGFVIDVLSSIPFEFFSAGSDMERMRALRFARLLKLFKFARVWSTMSRWKDVHPAVAKLSGLFNILSAVMFLAHIGACLWILSANLTRVDGVYAKDTWVMRQGQFKIADSEGRLLMSPSELYLICLYWSMTTMR